MSINLSKGEKIDLRKECPDLDEIFVGLGWDVNKGFGSDYDLDASVYLIGEDGRSLRPQNKVYYGHKQESGIKHLGDNLTGEGEGDDEVVEISLNRLDPRVSRLAFTVDIYQAKQRRQQFSKVRNSYIRIVNKRTGKELLRYDLGNDFGKETAVVVGEIYRYKGSFKFNAIGMGFEGGRQALEEHFN